MSTPRDQLAAYLAQRHLSYRAAAKLFRCSSTAVYRYVNGERRAQGAVAFRIQAATGISAESWVAEARD